MLMAQEFDTTVAATDIDRAREEKLMAMDVLPGSSIRNEAIATIGEFTKEGKIDFAKAKTDKSYTEAVQSLVATEL